MSRALALCALVGAAGCFGAGVCKPSTVRLSLSLDGAAASADRLALAVTVEGAVLHADGAHPPGVAEGSIEVDFPGGYPAGKTISLTVIASAGGRTVGGGSLGPLVLSGGCTALAMILDPTAAPDPDLGEGRDLSSRPDLGGADLPSLTCAGGATPSHVGELTEGDASRWASYLDPSVRCLQPTQTIAADTQTFTTGHNSIRLDSTCAAGGLIYPKDENAGWDLTKNPSLSFDIAGKAAVIAAATLEVRLVVDASDYFAYAPSKLAFAYTGGFAHFEIALDGGDPAWMRETVGHPTLAQVNAIEVSWRSVEPAESVWLDGLAFLPGPFLDCSP